MIQFDSRILAGKKPMTVFDTEEAEQFMNKEGYFSNAPTDFEDLSRCMKNTLVDVNHAASNVDGLNFHFCAGSKLLRFKFFLPAEWTVSREPEPEPEWRPYLIDEWLQEHNFGDMIEFRHKSIKRELTAMFTGQIREIDGTMRIILGANAYDFDELFEYYELIDKTNDGIFVWRPFGYRE